MTNLTLKLYTKTLLGFASLSLILIATGCTPPTGSPSTSPLKESTTPPDSESPYRSSGTISGGGGSSIDGKLIESYAVDIELLPEYRKHVLPILKKMSSGKPDVLIVYLTWAARRKAWYFIPRDLPTISSKQIQIPLDTDQPALHYDQQVLINSTLYNEKSAEEKAKLLLHEMVMAAKLLMKKPALTQCESLSDGLDQKLCHDPEILKTVNKSTEPKESVDASVLNGREHEDVRAMTIFLLDKKQELSGINVSSRRTHLQFLFPWEHMLSSAGTMDVQAALERAVLSEQKFRAKIDAYPSASGECELNYDLSPNTNKLASLTVRESALSVTPTAPLSAETSAADTPSGSKDNSLPFGWSSYVLGLYLYFDTYSVEPHNAVGVQYPSGSDRFVDMVEYVTESHYLKNDGTRVNLSQKHQLFLSREEYPRLLEVRFVPVNVRQTGKINPVTGFFEGVKEIIEIKSKPTIRCIPSDA